MEIQNGKCLHLISHLPKSKVSDQLRFSSRVDQKLWLRKMIFSPFWSTWDTSVTSHNYFYVIIRGTFMSSAHPYRLFILDCVFQPEVVQGVFQDKYSGLFFSFYWMDVVWAQRYLLFILFVQLVVKLSRKYAESGESRNLVESIVGC